MSLAKLGCGVTKSGCDVAVVVGCDADKFWSLASLSLGVALLYVESLVSGVVA
jgi:hypothetical protein